MHEIYLEKKFNFYLHCIKFTYFVLSYMYVIVLEILLTELDDGLS